MKFLETRPQSELQRSWVVNGQNLSERGVRCRGIYARPESAVQLDHIRVDDHKPSFLMDPGRNLFYCYGCGRGRRISLNGTITTVAGNGVPGYSGDGGPAVLAELSGPSGITLDKSGNLFVADVLNTSETALPSGRLAPMSRCRSRSRE
jgi:hypothetical protein